MPFDFMVYKETNNLFPVEIKNKYRYYYDLMDIENSWTGRLDVYFANTFLLESVQLVVNAITLFEKGYFDCAFYSLRQSLELSTTIAYLVDKEGDEREKELEKWKDQGYFPQFKPMSDFLEKNGSTFIEIKNIMKGYFESLESVKKKLNKYIHKQGFQTFYVSRNHPFHQKISREKFIAEFEEYLKVCIGAIAVFRLTIDPFPILLMDEEIYHRTGDLLTEAYSQDFIDSYIGQNYIEDFKTTSNYLTLYDFFMKEEKRAPCVTWVVKDHFIDNKNIDTIMKQCHLLDVDEFASVIIASVSNKINEIFCGNIFRRYTTSNAPLNDNASYSDDELIEFKKSGIKYNNIYNDGFLSVVAIYGNEYCFTHNETLNEQEIFILDYMANEFGQSPDILSSK